MASVTRRSQGTNWLRRVLVKVDLFEYQATSKVRNLGCGVGDQVGFWKVLLVEPLLIQVG